MDSQTYINALASEMGGIEIAFPLAEYRARMAAVREAMADAELDTLLVTHPCDLNYLTGYDTFGVANHACLILPCEGEPTLHAMTVEIPAAVVTTWIDDIVCNDWHRTDGIGAQLSELVAARGLARGRIGIQPARHGLRADIHGGLLANLSSATLIDASHLVARIRLIKSGAEIDCLRKAAAMTVAGIEASLGAIRPGATDNDVARAGFDAMLAAGSDFLAIQPIVTSGRRTGGGHQTHRRNRIETGDAVFMEYGGCYKRYTAPLMRSALLGAPDAETKRVEDTVLATVQALLDAIGPGRSCHDVALAAKRAHAGLDDFVYFSGAYGYHVGAAFPPTWADSIAYIAEGVEEELRPGMTFHLPIAMRLPGRFGVSLSESVLVTETGCELLTAHPRRLHIIDT